MKRLDYTFRGVVRKFRPDFLSRLVNMNTLFLEMKGEDSPQNQTKRQFLAEWIRAVNEHGGFGAWSSDVSRDPNDIAEIVEKHSTA